MGELALTVGWGHGGSGKPTMPGKGKVEERGYAENEYTCAEFGETTCDVYLNGVAYWRNVPTRVWDYIIGGYQVIKNGFRIVKRRF